jgi:hypothetical protein
MEVKLSASRDVTQTDTFGVKTAKVVTIISPCAKNGLVIYLEENPSLYLSNLTLNTDLTIAVHTLVR